MPTNEKKFGTVRRKEKDMILSWNKFIEKNSKNCSRKKTWIFLGFAGKVEESPVVVENECVDDVGGVADEAKVLENKVEDVGEVDAAEDGADCRG